MAIFQEIKDRIIEYRPIAIVIAILMIISFVAGIIVGVKSGRTQVNA